MNLFTRSEKSVFGMGVHMLWPLYLFLMISFTACSRREEKQKTVAGPNIVFILADDMGYGDVACLNPDAKVVTPNLDRLAAEGMIFTDAHAGSAVCTPTRYGLLTGRYAWRTRLQRFVLWPWDRPLIDTHRLTVARYLADHGYSTACIGKWHLGWWWPTTDSSRINDIIADGVRDMKKREAFGWKVDFHQKIGGGPLAAGFDYYFGDDVPNYPPRCFIENERTLGIPDRTKPDTMFGLPGPTCPGWRLDDVMLAITRKAVAYIHAGAEEKPFEKKKNAPFFLYLALTAPHTPIAPAPEFRGKSRAGAYGDYVQEVDWAVGEVLKALKEKGVAENTLVFFSSDNGSPGRDGTAMGGDLNSVLRYGHHPSYIYRGIKSDIWEGGHRVPFIARWPGHIPAGTESNEVICLTDLLATCAAIVGDSLPDDAAEDSYSLLPVLTGERYDKPLREATVHHSIAGCFSIRKGRWKLELCPGSGGWTLPRAQARMKGLPSVQLYDMIRDPSEKNNVAGVHPQVVYAMKKLLERYIRDGRSTPGAPQQNDVAVKWEEE